MFYSSKRGPFNITPITNKFSPLQTRSQRKGRQVMATILTTPGNFEIRDIAELLDDDDKHKYMKVNGNLDKKALQNAITQGDAIPVFFLRALASKHPTLPIPPELLEEPETERPVSPVRVMEGASGSNVRKRKITWLLHEWAGEDEQRNVREADGTLKALTEYDGPVQDGDIEIDPSKEIPEAFITNEDMAYWDTLFSINGKAYYNPEELALGCLKQSEFMLIPSNWEVDLCPIEHVGAGLTKFTPSMATIGGVYVLAKEQAKELNMRADDQIKWAVLRMEAYKAGWYDRQKFTAYKKLPAGYMSSMRADYDDILKYANQAYTLCAFLPYMCEYYFRSFGSAYTATNSGEYIQKATTLATSANINDCLAYMSSDILHGKVLAWVGVKRPMEVLRNAIAFERVPHPFQLRAYASPAGQALITSSIAVIDSIESSGWWSQIKRVGGYNDDLLVEVGNEITSDPWRYHVYCAAYGLPALDQAELKRVDDAKKVAARFAPLLQAYIQTLMQGSQLAGIKSIKKHAMNNPQMVKSCSSLFKTVVRAKFKNLEEVFATNAFRLTITEEADNRGGGEEEEESSGDAS